MNNFDKIVYFDLIYKKKIKQESMDIKFYYLQTLKHYDVTVDTMGWAF